MIASKPLSYSPAAHLVYGRPTLVGVPITPASVTIVIANNVPWTLLNPFDSTSGFLARIPILRAAAQRPSEVVLREPGERFLSAPRPILRYAIEHWEFAWLSVAAYGKTEAGQKQAQKDEKQIAAAPDSTAGRRYRAVYQDPESVLKEAGWSRWEFPGEALLEKISSSHLRVEVWQKKGARPAGRRRPLCGGGCLWRYRL